MRDSNGIAAQMLGIHILGVDPTLPPSGVDSDLSDAVIEAMHLESYVIHLFQIIILKYTNYTKALSCAISFSN